MASCLESSIARLMAWRGVLRYFLLPCLRCATQGLLHLPIPSRSITRTEIGGPTSGTLASMNIWTKASVFLARVAALPR